MNYKIIEYNSPEYYEMLNLRNKILREPLGLKITNEDLETETNDIFCTFVDNNNIAACCILTKQNDKIVKIRQMAVDMFAQKKGIGSALLNCVENTARENGYETITLHARQTACNFYTKQGYEAVGDLFYEVGIPHIEMTKRIDI